MTKSLSSLLLLSAATAISVAQGYVDNQQQPMMPTGLTNLPPLGNANSRPNIVFILVDDQDLQMNSLSYTPIAIRELKEKGTFYKNHFVTTALCCPSRVSLWTGRQAHNTNVTDVNIPHGGYPKFVRQGFNDDWFPIWMQDAGYDTYYVGKLFNMHTTLNYNNPYVKGFTGSDFLLDPYTYSYLNASYQRNHDPPVSYEGYHTMDVLSTKAYDFLSDALNKDNPFFIGIAPPAPHTNIPYSDPLNLTDGLKLTPPIPLERHKDLFPDAKVPRTENFNPDKPSGVNWIAEMPKQNQSNVDYNDYLYRRRLQALQACDELVGGVIKRLEEHNALDNTYIIYSSDNGYHIGQHRLQPGKECGFEEDVRVPLFIRGPGVPENRVVDTVTTHIDLAPTMFEMAGIPLREDFDGTPIPVSKESMEDETFQRHEHVAIEYWGYAVGEGLYGRHSPDGPAIYHDNNTYKALRVIGDGYNFYYSVWCNNEHQLYDLLTDPYEMNNLYPSSLADMGEENEPQLMGLPLSKVITRLDALTFVLKSCKGVACIRPWDVLHPEGDVTSLKDALEADFDAFYTAQVKVSYDRCERGYILDAEGPQVPLIYRGGLSWSDWA